MELLELGERGGGRPVVLVHGLAAAARAGWARTGWVRELERAGLRPLGPDLPGHGAAPGPVPGTTRSGLVAELVRLVEPLARAQGAPVPVAGYSLGAQLAWAAAAASPAVGPLVLGGLGVRDRLPALADALRAPPPGRGGPADTPAAAVPGRAAVPEHAAGRGGGPAHVPGSAAALADLLLRTAPDPGAAPRWAALAGAVGAEAFDPAAAVPSQPALLLAGGADPWADPQALARVRRTSGAPTEVLVVPGRGHVDVLTAGAARRAAAAFLSRGPGS
ncbi:alpha/beta fold hydrolase [Kocuria flava]|uniref:alpha/beta fold hydrolase n=1 Tax=Kocuria flava TaxID=446860 RepID=UPI003F1D5DA6